MSSAKCHPFCFGLNVLRILWAGLININVTSFDAAALHPEIYTVTNIGPHSPEYICTLSISKCDHSDVGKTAMMLCCHAHVWSQCVNFEVLIIYYSSRQIEPIRHIERTCIFTPIYSNYTAATFIWVRTCRFSINMSHRAICPVISYSWKRYRESLGGFSVAVIVLDVVWSRWSIYHLPTCSMLYITEKRKPAKIVLRVAFCS